MDTAEACIFIYSAAGLIFNQPVLCDAISRRETSALPRQSDGGESAKARRKGRQ